MDFPDYPQVQPLVEFVKAKHCGQKRMDGSPYWTHPVAVAKLCLSPCGLDELGLKIALGHDILEDTETTFDELSALIGPEAARGVQLLTKSQDKPKEAEERQDWTIRYYRSLRNAPKYVLSVKAMDRVHNLSEMAVANRSFRSRYLLDTVFLIAALEGYANEDHLGLLKMTFWHVSQNYIIDT